jgi:DNA-binding winged helix-turn-helix (wHTH) protein
MINNNPFQFPIIRCAFLEVNLALGVVKNSFGNVQRLSPINLKLLSYLLMNQGQVVSRTELFDAVWPNQLIGDDVLTRAVSDIRMQLAKLDPDTKFIETLPKRGYRWIIDVSPVVDSSEDESDSEPGNLEAIHQPMAVEPQNNWIKILCVYISSAIFFALIVMWALSRFLSVPEFSVAVLPTVAARPAIEPMARTTDEAILNVLRKNTQIKLLSASAIRSRPQNPFPYFFTEFDAKWIIESRINDLNGINNVELSLVDARTGIELRNINFDVNNKSEIFIKVAQKLESDFLIEPLPY